MIEPAGLLGGMFEPLTNTISFFTKFISGLVGGIFGVYLVLLYLRFKEYKKVVGLLTEIKQEIKLENITFTFPKKEEPALNQLNITIPVNSLIGIVGPSGSGKSTLIDILLALIDPQKGELKVDNNVINKINW